MSFMPLTEVTFSDFEEAIALEVLTNFLLKIGQ